MDEPDYYVNPNMFGPPQQPQAVPNATPTQGPVGGALMTAATPQAMRDRYMLRGDEADANALKAQETYDKTASEKMAEIQRIMQQVSSQQPDRTRLLAAISAGFLKPTKTGGFAESLGNVGEAAQGPLSDIEKFQQAKQSRIQALGLSGMDMNMEQAKQRLALEQSRGTRADTQVNAYLKMIDDARKEKALQTYRDEQNRLRQARLDKPPNPPQPRQVSSELQMLNERYPLVDAEGAPLTGDALAAAQQARNDAMDALLSKDQIAPVPTIESMNSAGAALGLPEMLSFPFTGIPDRKTASDIMKAAITSGEAVLRDPRNKLLQASSVLSKGNEFMNLNARTSSGPERLIPGSVTLGGSDIRRMQAISDELTPSMRDGMPGAASDRDVNMFRGATFGVDKPMATNQAIYNAMQRHADNLENFIDFKETMLKTYHSTSGADVAWQRYLNANPIFLEGSTQDAPALNPNRQDWREYFANERARKALDRDDVKKAVGGLIRVSRSRS